MGTPVICPYIPISSHLLQLLLRGHWGVQKSRKTRNLFIVSSCIWISWVVHAWNTSLRRHPEGIIASCMNHLDRLSLMLSSSGSTLTPPNVWVPHPVSEDKGVWTHFRPLYPPSHSLSLSTVLGHKWGQNCKSRKSSSSASPQRISATSAFMHINGYLKFYSCLSILHPQSTRPWDIWRRSLWAAISFQPEKGNVNIFQMGKMALELVLILIPATTHQKILNILRHQGFGLDWVLFILYTSELPIDWWKPTRRRPYGNRAWLLAWEWLLLLAV